MNLENQDSIGGHDQAAQQSEPKAQIVPAATELELPPPKPECEHPCKERKHWLDYVTFGLELLGLVVLCVYAAYTIKIYCANRDAADAATEAATAATSASQTAIQTMHVDERAWINILTGKSVMVDNSPLVMPITIINQGKTAALNVDGKMFVNLLPVKDEPDFVYKHGHPAYKLGLKALLPNRPSEESPFAALPKYANPRKPVTPIIVTPTLRNEIAAGQLYIVVYLRLDYDDVFGVHHWLQFCAHAENGIPGVNAHNAGTTCGDYNDVDRNF
jgi:hypothetical protein